MRALYIQWRVDVGTRSLLLIALIQEAFATVDFHQWNIEVTFSIGALSIESSGWLDKVLNFCLDPISIHLVLAVFKVSLLERSHLFRLPKS